MPNQLRGEVPLPGTGYVLRYDVNALCEVEAAVGGNILEIITKLQDGTPPSFTTIRLLLWAGLRSGKPDMPIAQAGAALQDVGLQVAVDAIGEAFTASFPLAESDPGKNP